MVMSSQNLSKYVVRNNKNGRRITQEYIFKFAKKST